jgi:hypothetical protein
MAIALHLRRAEAMMRRNGAGNVMSTHIFLIELSLSICLYMNMLLPDLSISVALSLGVLDKVKGLDKFIFGVAKLPHRNSENLSEQFRKSILIILSESKLAGDRFLITKFRRKIVRCWTGSILYRTGWD